MLDYHININNNSTFTNDFNLIKNDASYTKWQYVDDAVKTIILNGSYVFNNNPYNIIYITSNGIVGFNSSANINTFTPTDTTASNIIGFFLPWADLNTTGTGAIYYKEDLTNKTFNILFDNIYYSTTATNQVELTLFLTGNLNSGNALLNFGTLNNNSNFTIFGFSLGSGNINNLIRNVSLTTDSIFSQAQSPYIDLTNVQSQLSNKQILISAFLKNPTIGTFTIPTKTYGDTPFEIINPSSNSSGLFSYTSSNTSVATILGNIITIVGAGITTITATQAATTDYTFGKTTATFQVKQSTSSNPTIISDVYGLSYFMTSSASYANLINDIEIEENLLASTNKVLTGNDIKITKNSNN